jgi:hypothetical protein
VARDYYAEATNIAEGASRVGLDDLNQRLRQAIDEGFTATDTLMRIRSALLDFRTSLADNPDLQSRSHALIRGIDEALR